MTPFWVCTGNTGLDCKKWGGRYCRKEGILGWGVGIEWGGRRSVEFFDRERARGQKGSLRDNGGIPMGAAGSVKNAIKRPRDSGVGSWNSKDICDFIYFYCNFGLKSKIIKL